MGFRRKYAEPNASARQAIHQAYTMVFLRSGSRRPGSAERLLILEGILRLRLCLLRTEIRRLTWRCNKCRKPQFNQKPRYPA
jgi:hypothetical protein